jgi:hypothetical protein
MVLLCWWSQIIKTVSLNMTLRYGILNTSLESCFRHRTFYLSITRFHIELLQMTVKKVTTRQRFVIRPDICILKIFSHTEFNYLLAYSSKSRLLSRLVEKQNRLNTRMLTRLIFRPDMHGAEPLLSRPEKNQKVVSLYNNIERGPKHKQNRHGPEPLLSWPEQIKKCFILTTTLREDQNISRMDTGLNLS